MKRLLKWLRNEPKPLVPPYAVPGTGVTDLAATLYRIMAAVPPPLRQNATWVMDTLWFRHILSMPQCAPFAPVMMSTPPNPVLLGLPVQIRDGAGWPHLEQLTDLPSAVLDLRARLASLRCVQAGWAFGVPDDGQSYWLDEVAAALVPSLNTRIP